MGVLCKSAGVVLAAARVEGAGALRRDPAGESEALLTGAGRGCPSGEDLALLLEREPVLTAPECRPAGGPGDCGYCSPEWGKSPAGSCDLEPC